jgi:hypothetical protein
MTLQFGDRRGKPVLSALDLLWLERGLRPSSRWKAQQLYRETAAAQAKRNGHGPDLNTLDFTDSNGVAVQLA